MYAVEIIYSFLKNTKYKGRIPKIAAKRIYQIYSKLIICGISFISIIITHIAAICANLISQIENNFIRSLKYLIIITSSLNLSAGKKTSFPDFSASFFIFHYRLCVISFVFLIIYAFCLSSSADQQFRLIASQSLKITQSQSLPALCPLPSALCKKYLT